MEEKKVCPECENKEQKPVELTDEEMEKTSGGYGLHGEQVCSNCGLISGNSKVCEYCGKKF